MNTIATIVVAVIKIDASLVFRSFSLEYMTATSAVGIIVPNIIALIVIDAVLKNRGKTKNSAMPGVYLMARPLSSDKISSFSKLKSRKYPITNKANVVFGIEICSARFTIRLGNLMPMTFKMKAII
ncbi:hypothetical protein V518_1680 [Thermoanaerobacterium aotearoense SCUT27]|uniref:Uncharacterized protein n=1 Tax=Thermoanaerobacterium aotearoense SCUT27 TaxID=1421016 RepID=W9EAZ1_9THEO|nr:hypothetical protein V518_1680 [Thermoanaerobacterium aotearoense SCUT27]